MDKRNAQIMEILAQNCRISNAAIASTLNISKSAVTNRIANLESTGLLGQYVLFIDARKLSFTRYHILLRLQTNVPNKDELFANACKHPFVMWANTFIGRYDIQFIVDAKSSFELNKIRHELFQLLNNKVQEYIILTHLFDLEFTQLNPVLDLSTSFPRKNDSSFSATCSNKSFPVSESFNEITIDTSDMTILKALADNPRASLTDISSTTSLDRKTVKSHILNMIASGLILSFGGIPNLSRLGFVTYYLLVRVSSETPKEVLQRPFSGLRNIFYAGRMLGDYDMILYLNARSPQELHSSIELVTSEIGKYLLHYDLLVQEQVLHWRQYTEGIHKSLQELPR